MVQAVCPECQKVVELLEQKISLKVISSGCDSEPIIAWLLSVELD